MGDDSGEAVERGGEETAEDDSELRAMKPKSAKADDNECDDELVLDEQKDDAEEEEEVDKADDAAGRFVAVLAALFELMGGWTFWPATLNALSNRCSPSSLSMDRAVPTRGIDFVCPRSTQ